LKDVVEGEKDVMNCKKQDTCEDGRAEDMNQDSDNLDSPHNKSEDDNDKKNNRKRKRSVM